MEVIGGVASVITVVTLALQSTKVVYEAVNSIDHGSDGIDRLVRATTNLERLLKIINGLAGHAQVTNNVAEGKLLEELTPLVEQCDSTLREILPKLKQMQKNSNDRRWQKARKIVKVYLDTKGVADMWNAVNNHVELIGSFLSKASVEVGLYNAQEISIFRDEFSSNSQDHKSRFSHIEEVLRDQRTLAQAGFDAIQNELRQGSIDYRAAATTQIQGIAEIRKWQQQSEDAANEQYSNIADLSTNLNAIKTTVIDGNDQVMTEFRKRVSEAGTASYAQFEDAKRRNDAIKHELHSISNHLEGIDSMTSEQLTTLQTLVSMINDIQLERRMGRQNTHNDTTNKAYPTADDNLDMTHDPQYEVLVARISNLASKVAIHKYSRDAQLIIEDVGKLLNLVMQQFSAANLDRDNLSRKRKILCDYHYNELEMEVRSLEALSRAKRVLNSSQRVQLSVPDLQQHNESDNPGSSYLNHTRKTLTKKSRKRRVPITHLQSIARSWTLRHARLDAVFRTMLLQGTEDQDTDSNEDFAAKLVVTPTSAQTSNLQIIIDIASRDYQNGTVYFTPTLTFRAIIPDDSEVFRIVKSGSVRQLKRLLSTGAASLGDCDPVGRSLLNFALYKGRRKMTSFLIRSGADVETLEPGLEEFYAFPVKPLGMLPWVQDADRSDEDITRVDACHKILLDAGSDVSSIMSTSVCPEDYNAFSAFSQALWYGSLVKVKALVDLGEPFINLESRGNDDSYYPSETVPLLLLADDCAHRWGENYQLWGKIALLLSRGAKANARNPAGKNCLHLVLAGHGHSDNYCFCDNELRWRQYLSEIKNVLILMISAGADVCAVDEFDDSVSDFAFDSGLETVWIEALKYCGIGIEDVLARSDFNPAYSTAVDPRYSHQSESVKSKISLTECLERRKVFEGPQDEVEREGKLSPELSSSEDGDSDDEDLAKESSDEFYNQDEDPGERNNESDDDIVPDELIHSADENEQDAIGESENTHIKHEASIFKGKAKLE